MFGSNSSTQHIREKIFDKIQKSENLDNAEGISNIYQKIFELRSNVPNGKFNQTLNYIDGEITSEEKKSTKPLSGNKYINILIDSLSGKKDGIEHAVIACQMGLEILRNSYDCKDKKEQYIQDLRTIYAGYITRFTSDNQRIWNTGAIFVPVSLAGFVAYVRIDTPTLFQIAIISLSSILLIWSWVIIAENHRSFQDKSMIWINAIEKVMNVDLFNSTKFAGNDFLSRNFAKEKRIKIVRVWLPIIITIMWFSVLFYEYTNTIVQFIINMIV